MSFVYRTWRLEISFGVTRRKIDDVNFGVTLFQNCTFRTVYYYIIWPVFVVLCL